MQSCNHAMKQSCNEATMQCTVEAMKSEIPGRGQRCHRSSETAGQGRGVGPQKMGGRPMCRSRLPEDAWASVSALSSLPAACLSWDDTDLSPMPPTEGVSRDPQGKPPASPFSRLPRVRRGSKVKAVLTCTFTTHKPGHWLSNLHRTALRLEGRARTIAGHPLP